MTSPLISIIIPVWREETVINEALSHIYEIVSSLPIEIIVVDSAPDRSTLKVIADDGVKKVTAQKSRALQMNAGTRHATGNILLFLHADTRLPQNGLRQICKLLEGREIAGGAFDLSIDSPRTAFRVIAWAASKRSRWTRIPYGDQALFIRRSVFEETGGYPEIPIMEDVALMRRLKREKRRIGFISEPVLTSARRWEKEGIVFGTLRNWALISLYTLGVSPTRLACFYR